MGKNFVCSVEGIDRAALKDVLEERGYGLGGQEEEGTALVLRGYEKKELGEGAFELSKQEEQAKILYGDVRGFFRGLGELLISIRLGEDIQERKGKAESRGGAMYDCSRNGVLRPETIRGYIRCQALLGLERLFLYTEDTYEVKGYPYFGALRGRYTEEEIRKLDAYAARFGIEMIPCIQTLAHLRTALRWPVMRKYRDTEDILLAEDEETYKLIDAMLAAVSRMYRTRKVHVGMDEAFYLGYGNYRKKHGEISQAVLIRRHLDRVMELCAKHGLEPMIWSDMFFAAAGEGDYDRIPPEYEWKEEEKPDRRVTLVYWDYEGNDKQRYAKMIALHKKLGDQICFAGGSWIWNGLAPCYAKSESALTAAFEGLREAGATDTFLTLWLDNGAETPMAAGVPMLIFYAALVWGRKPEEDDLEAWTQMLCAESWKDLLLLDRFDHIPGTGEWNETFSNPCKMLFYQDPMLGIFDRQFEGQDLSEYYGRLEKDLSKVQESAGRFQGLYQYYRLLAKILEGKSTLGTRMRRAYLSGDRQALAEMADAELPKLAHLTEELKEAREKLWMEEYKPFGFEVLDIRICGVAARLRSASRRIREWLDGRVGRLEELEEERLMYMPESVRETPFCNLWEEIASPSNLTGV